MTLAAATVALGTLIVGASRSDARSPRMAATARVSTARLCEAAFPWARETSHGSSTDYNMQASVQAVACQGFGFDTKFHIDSGVVCSLIAAATGISYEKQALYIDGACNAAAVEKDPGVGSESAAAYSMLSDLAGMVPVAKAYAIAAGVSCAFGGPVGSWIEEASERQAAKGVIDHGKCLQFTKHSFPLGDTWSAVRCAANDPGLFSTNGPTRSSKSLIVTPTGFGGLANPSTLAVAISRFGAGVNYNSPDPADCYATWSSLGIRTLFQDFSKTSGVSCRPAGGFGLSDAELSGTRWVTKSGLRIGNREAKLHQLYPSARLDGCGLAPASAADTSVWMLASVHDSLGGPGTSLCTLGVVVANRIVEHFEVSNLGASE